jgi:hypothetical protein
MSIVERHPAREGAGQPFGESDAKLFPVLVGLRSPRFSPGK